jgi:hypothetical protein
MKTCEICAAVIPDSTSSVFYCTTKKEYVNKDDMFCDSFIDRDNGIEDEEIREITAEAVEQLKKDMPTIMLHATPEPATIEKDEKHVKRLKRSVVHCEFKLKGRGR